MRRVPGYWFGLLVLAVVIAQPVAGSARQEATSGIVPVAIRIPKALINTTVEPLKIADGSAENPSGTWTVGWYEQYGPLGHGDNTIFYGYPDFLGVGPAVFWFLPDLIAGDAIEVLGDDELIHPFVVDSVAMHEWASPPLEEIFADHESETLTFFGPAPPYDEQGRFLGLVLVRAVPAGEPFALLERASRTEAVDCYLDPRLLKIDGHSVYPIDVEGTAGTTDLAGAVPADAQTVESIQAILQAADCPIAVREALLLEDGRVITLVGPPGFIPLDELTSVGGYDSLSSAREAKVMAYVLFAPNNGGWEAEGISW